MSLDSLMVHTVTVRSPTYATDDYGNQAKVWGDGTATRAWVSQRSSVEITADRETAISQWVVYLPATVVITADDRVEWGDYVFEVDGNPLPAWTPRGHHHTEAALVVAQ